MLNTKKNEINNSYEFFFIAISLLERDQKTNLIPELMQILTPKQLILLSQVFGGKSIKFPSNKELSIALKTALVIYENKIMNNDFETIQFDHDIPDFEMKIIGERMKIWEDDIKNTPGIDYYKAMSGDIA